MAAKPPIQTCPDLPLADRRAIAREAMEVTKKLTLAITKGDMVAFDKALAMGAMPDWCHFGRGSKSKGSALGEALKHRNLQMLETLIDAGATAVVPKRTESLLTLALSMGFAEAVALFCERFDVSPTPDDYALALFQKTPEAFKALEIRHPLPRNVPVERRGWSAMYPAFLAQSGPVLQYLIDTGADPALDMDESNGKTSFMDNHVHSHLAMRDSMAEVFSIALHHGVQVEHHHLEQVVSNAMRYSNPSVEVLDVLARHCPTWSWRQDHPTLKDFAANRPAAFDALCQREDDRKLRTTLQDTLVPGVGVRRKML
jgi:hypothetical protein